MGGGVSGLVAGIYALQAGFEVDIYEINGVSGGMCAQWRRQGIVCPNAINWMMGFRQGSSLHTLWENVGVMDEESEFLKLEYISAVPDGQDGYLYAYSDLNRFRDELLTISPDDEVGILNLMRAIELYRGYSIYAEKPEEMMTPIDKAIAFLPHIRAEKKVLFKDKSVAEYVKEFQSPLIRKLLLSVLPDARLNVRMLLNWLASSANEDIAVPLSGFFCMTRKIERKFLALGGKLHLATPVKRIEIKDDSVTGLLLKDDEFVKADYVVSTVSPDILLNELLDSRYQDGYFEQRLNAVSNFYTPSMTLINLACRMKGTIPHTLVVETAFALLKIKHYSFSIEQSTGKNLLQVFLQDQEYDKWVALKSRSEEAYREKKESLARLVVQEVESVYPELKGGIEILDVATPLTLQRYCHSYKGAYLAFCPLVQLPRRENHPGTISGIDKLFVAGQWAFQEGGLSMAAISGKFAVQRILYRKQRLLNLKK
ncbi:MAG: NAD(P)/FAD-dependent oxidoreductase [Bacteroides sp.]|nr:NAD(P)/FAD-dependent oxidoreductase [Bacteroides sp.]